MTANLFFRSPGRPYDFCAGFFWNWKARPAQLLSLPQPRSRDMSRLLPRAQRQPLDHNASAPVPPGPLPPSWVQAWSWALVLTRASFSSAGATYPTHLPSPLRCWPGSGILTSVLTLGSLSRKPFLGTCSLYLSPLCFFSSVIQKSGCIKHPCWLPLSSLLLGTEGMVCALAGVARHQAH